MSNDIGQGKAYRDPATGRVLPGNCLALKTDKSAPKRVNYRRVLREQYTEEAFSQGLRCVIAASTDFRKPHVQLKAFTLLCELSNLLTTNVNLDVEERPSHEQLRVELWARLAELQAAKEAQKPALAITSAGESAAGAVAR